MAYLNEILTSMHEKCIYRPVDLAAAVNVPVNEASRVLKLLHKGGMIELIEGDGYRRKKMYKTKQRSLI